MKQHRVPVVVIAVAALLAGCGLPAVASRGTTRGIRIDDRNRNDAVCGTADESNRCQGALQALVVPNPSRREYAVIWQGWYSGSDQDGIRLYGRRFDASTGRPQGPSVDLAQDPRGNQFAATYDPSTRSYAVAWQLPTESYTSPQRVAVQRFDETLRPTGLVTQLTGNWLLLVLAAESGGRVAVIGAQNDHVSLASPGSGSLGLHVETIDANDNPLSVTTRDAGAMGLAAGVSAAYDRRTHNLLVAWIPVIANQGARAVRVDQIDPTGAGRVVTLPLSPAAPSGQTDLACNEVRRECLLVYADDGPSLADLRAHLLGPDAQPRGPSLDIATSTRGPIGIDPVGDGYTIAWNQGGVIAPVGSRVVIARLTDPAPKLTTLVDRQLPGQAQFAAAGSGGTGLLIWRPPVYTGPPFGTAAWFQIRGQIIGVTHGR